MLLNRRELPSTTDLISAAGTARDNGHEVALIERPLPEAVSVAALGKAFELVATEGGASLEDADGQVIDTEPGDNRIAAAARLWNRFANGRAAGGADQSPSDLIAVGGWAFDPDADPQGPWLGFPSLLLRVPALALVRKRGRVFATATSAQAWDLLKPGATSFQAPGASRIKVDLAQSAAKWLNIVEQVRHRIRADEASKVVLAREVLADGDGVIAAAEVGRALRASFPGCYTYVIGGSDGSALVGASPELLIRRRGSLALSEPMAGSIRRGRDEDEDDRLAQELLSSAKDRAEHALVPAHIESALLPVSSGLSSGPLGVVRLTNIQHLATTIRAELAGPPYASALDIAALLHPTPAICGHPFSAARRMIAELEGINRGWYAGGVGWIDGSGDGEFAVALRCGLLESGGSHMYAGCGIMAGSDPAAELAETDLKLEALTAALTASA